MRPASSLTGFVPEGYHRVRMKTALIVLGVTGALWPSFDSPADDAPAVFDDAATDDRALSSRLRRIETAFRDGDAGSLRASFASGARLRVELPDLTEGQGSYGAGQLQVIFGRIFDQFRTQEFAFAADDVRVSQPGTAFARGRWVRRSRPRDWRILEIRASR
jgi:hypothetical protein